MMRLKQITAVHLLLICGFSYSGTLGSLCSPGSTNPACEKNGWSLQANALYLQPTFGGDGLGYSSFSNYNGADNNGIQVGINGSQNPVNNALLKWDWGFQLGGSYLFNENDLTLNWYHVRDDTDTSLPSNSLFGGSVDGFYASHIQVLSQWDELSLDLAHHTSFDDKKTLRFYAGLEYANIKNTIINYPLLYPGQSPIFITHDKINFNGFGPRVGGDFNYAVTTVFDVYLNSAFSLLVGKGTQYITGYHDVLDFYGLDPYGIPNYNHSRSGLIVPEIAAKLGIKYSYLLAKNQFTFDVGYLWIDYLHALSAFTGIGIVGSSYGNMNSANYNLNGISAGVKWTS